MFCEGLHNNKLELMSSSLLRIIRYAFVGILTVSAYLGVVYALSKFDLPISYGAPIAFLTAVLINYVLQRKIVFLDHQPVISSLPKYVVMVTVGLIVNSAVLATLSPQIPLFWSQIVAVFAVVLTNTAFAFLWVFVGAE